MKPFKLLKGKKVLWSGYSLMDIREQIGLKDPDYTVFHYCDDHNLMILDYRYDFATVLYRPNNSKRYKEAEFLAHYQK